MVSQGIVGQGVLKQSHCEFDTKDPAHSIVDTAHGDNIGIHKQSEIINESGVVIRNHDLHAKVLPTDE